MKRKPLQGITNIIRFNWDFYLIALISFIILLLVYDIIPISLRGFVVVALLLSFFSILISFIISYYIYDRSDLYELKWLPNLNYKKVVNINAGFDETSHILMNQYPNTNLIICDFYDDKRHTEASIKRARKVYPPLSGTIQVNTQKLPFEDKTFDYVLAILSVHEIRDKIEREQFFNELYRITKPEGQVFVTEHLRDWRNFVAYTIGFFHFHSRATWKQAFKSAHLVIDEEIKTTPFITTFKLKKNGDTL